MLLEGISRIVRRANNGDSARFQDPLHRDAREFLIRFIPNSLGRGFVEQPIDAEEALQFEIDFYRGSIAAVREAVRNLCSEVPDLHWLPDAGVVPLTDETCLVGADGWGDGRLGDYHGSDVILNDWGLIEEFGGFDEDPEERLAKLHALGDESAAHLCRVLPEALRRFRHVVVLTHVPPFREACWHEGRISDDNWLPHFTCKAVGDALLQAMTAAPGQQMTVLCGHTHGGGEAQVLPNLRVLTGNARYGQPVIQRVLEVPR